MAGQTFQYDESGSTFFYFVLSFLALILVPSTYYLWPSNDKDGKRQKKQDTCQCNHCIVKEAILKQSEPKKKLKKYVVRFIVLIGWAIFVAIAWKVAQFDYEYANFDPYEILNIDPSTSETDIKKAYRKLSLIYHPDKETGDEKKFMKLTKAYQALTDSEARRNWEKYGNPDGPGPMSFGIALPSWIVEKENSVWVLGLYALVFMIGLPTVVGMWWYQSIRYSGEQVLLDTTQLYYYFFHKTPHVIVRRIVMILAASLEFEKGHNKEVQERPSDDIEVPKLIKRFTNLCEKNKERPLCFPYSIKARAILYAHLSRMDDLSSNTLELDRQYIVKKCPYLIQEMVTCVAQLVMLHHAGRINRLPTLETIENCMKLSAMLVQGLWESQSPLLQLPHITDDNLRHFVTKKRQIRSIQQFVQMKESDRRALVKSLTDEQFRDIMFVAKKMPLIEFGVQSEVVDDEEPSVYTAGAIVTVTVKLIRRNLEELFGDSSSDQHVADEKEEEEENEKEKDKKSTSDVKKPVWQKQNKKGKKGGKKNTKKTPSRSAVRQVDEKAPGDSLPPPTQKSKVVAKVDEEESSESEASDSEPDGKEIRNMVDDKDSSSDEDDEDWAKLQKNMSKEKALEGKSKISHSVHCPFFPEDKQEFWWVYVADRKKRMLITAPYLVTDLIEKDEVQLKFTAPTKTGIYTYTVCLRSDSYLGFDQLKDIKLDVKEAREIDKHPQWEFSEDEEEKEDESSKESEFATDDELEKDDDK